MHRRVLRLFSRKKRDRERELDEELEAHIQMRIADLEARGVSRERARAEALARFGDLPKTKRTLYAAAARRDRTLRWREGMDTVRRDLGVAFRRMNARRARTALVLSIFALGIGVTTAMFTVVDNVMFRSLPFHNPHELVELQSVTDEGQAFSQVSMGNWYDWREEGSSLAGTGLYQTHRVAVGLGDHVERVDAAQVAGAFFETLVTPMRLGRPLTEEDGQAQAAVVVVSETYWRTALGGQTPVEGVSISVDGRERTVVGVVMAGFEFPEGTDVWMPQRYGARLGGSRNNLNYQSVARLSGGVSLQSAKAELDGIANGIRSRDPEGLYSWGVGVEPLRHAIVGDTARSLQLLMGSVLLVLVLACVNLMGLGLAEGRERTDEVAVRMALGAGRPRLVQQLVTEQLAFAVLGGALGMVVAWLGTRAAISRLSGVLPRADEIAMDGRVAIAGVALSVVAGVVSGLLPAWRVSNGEPAAFLSRARTVTGGRGLPGSWLVATEIALTVVLLTGGALLVRSFSALTERDLGFEPARVVTLDLTLNTPEYLQDSERITAYWDRMQDVLSPVPGVESVAVGTGIPTGTGGKGFIGFPDDPNSERGARYRVVSEGYFSTLGVGLVEGRRFDVRDTPGSERVVIINRTMADQFWPEGAIGKSVSARSMESYWYDGTAPWLRVIGIVEDIRMYGFEDDPEPAMFTLYRQIPQLALAATAVVRLRPGLAVEQSAAGLREALRGVDPSLAVETGVLENRVHGMLLERRLVTSIILAFAMMALVLAWLGTYGMLALAVSARTPELAIRAALGAGQRDLVRMVVEAAVAVVAVGAGLGALGVLGAHGVLDSLLVDVELTDPATYLVVGGVLLSVVLLAVWVPALKAARMSPMEALRNS